MILSNLSASSGMCATLAALRVPIIQDKSSSIGYYATQSRCSTCLAPDPYPSGQPQDVAALPLLLDAFVRAAQTNSMGNRSKGNLHFLAGVFANLSAVHQASKSMLFPRLMNHTTDTYWSTVFHGTPAIEICRTWCRQGISLGRYRLIYGTQR